VPHKPAVNQININMRKLLGIAFLTLILVIGGAMRHPQDHLLTATDYGSRLYQSHQSDRPIPTGAIALAPSVPVEGQAVTYGLLGEQPITGYLARPVDAMEPLPGLIVIHEAWGLNDNIKRMTDRLAGNELGKSAEIYIYEGADHAFANPSGTRYNPEAAEDA
jgi:carboxymethylenebutenolidase